MFLTLRNLVNLVLSIRDLTCYSSRFVFQWKSLVSCVCFTTDFGIKPKVISFSTIYKEKIFVAAYSSLTRYYR